MMFEAQQYDHRSELMHGAWFAVERRGDGWQNDVFLCKDGIVRGNAAGFFKFDRDTILADPTSAYYPTQAAALAAIHAHYHGGDTETIEPGDIAATLREEE